jgi:8-oxo-dGTP pyrophosphatase MutT (NUDIX family)
MEGGPLSSKALGGVFVAEIGELKRDFLMQLVSTNGLTVEKCDVVDEFGDRTGRTVPRGTKLGPDEYFLVVHVWIRDKDGEYLIQQRAPHLQFDPGIWATTVGYVRAGEDSVFAALREISEELGIHLTPGHLQQLGRCRMQSRIEDLWLAEVSRNSTATPTLGAEVTDWKWVSKLELEQMVTRGDFFPYSYLGILLE